MNECRAVVERCGAGWRVAFRASHKAGYNYIMDGDRPRIYPSAEAAQKARGDALERFINSPMVRCGATLSSERSMAEKHFSTIFRSGRRIEVATR